MRVYILCTCGDRFLFTYFIYFEQIRYIFFISFDIYWKVLSHEANQPINQYFSLFFEFMAILLASIEGK